MQSLRGFLELVSRERPQDILNITETVNPEFETQAIIDTLEQSGSHPIIRFSKLTGYDMEAVANIHASRDLVAFALGTSKEELSEEWLRRTEQRFEPVLKETGPVQELVFEGEVVDLRHLPIFTHCGEDAGPYITSGVMVGKDPDKGVYNASFHRCQVKGPSKLGVSLHSRRHLWDYQRRAEQRNQPLPVAIVIGVHPAITLAAASLGGMEVDEYEIAGALLGAPLELVKCRTVDLKVPAQAEIVIEGEIIPNFREPEGPFSEFTGYLSRRSTDHVISVKAITMRKNAIYQDIPGGLSSEHALLGGIPREVSVLKSIKEQHPSVKNVCYPVSGTSRLHCYVSIEKTYEGQGKNVILSAMAADNLLKFVVVVDEDIDVFNETRVLWAVATRMQAGEDLFIVPKAAAAMLDPSTQGGLSDKLGIDATKCLKGWEAVIPTIPTEAMQKAKQILSRLI